MKLVQFWHDENGQISIDWTVLTAALMGIGLVVSTEVAIGVDHVTDEYAGINTGEGMMTMFVGGDDESTDGGRSAELDDGEDNAEFCIGNPGNDKCVGKAGESPNGDDFGDGSRGKSDTK